ncbi:MAG TPA: biotin--[acetyl-CoA-carboxylase] ligase [Nitrosopumilaceae archaeon]|nr:biotin--[acetyl-CoA-carboxylase] ligase [Nitrosopumilaceae archaeon]
MIYNSFDNVGLVRVLSFLKSHNTEYLSGQDLSDVLKISRVAVWKHIKKIRSLGYKIESKQKLGYKLVKTTNLLLPWEITDELKTKTIGKRAYYFDSIDSTQNFAMEIASNSKENGTVVISQRQTKGRGRLGRKWLSPIGGIWISIVFHPKFDISMSTLFPIAASVALSNSIEKIFDKKTELKWPNDVTIKGKKVAGMLIDVSIESNKIESLVLGVGINFKVNTSQLEKSLKNTDNFYGIATLVNNEKDESPIVFIKNFLYELEKIFELLEKGKSKIIIKDWTEKSSTIGKNISVETTNGKIKGRAIKLDNDGALVVKTNNQLQRVLAGDIIQKN